MLFDLRLRKECDQKIASTRPKALFELEPNYRHMEQFNGKTMKFGIFSNCLIIYADNSFYLGSVNIDNERQGEGTYIDTIGNKYSGQWNKNSFDGLGVLVNTNGEMLMGYFLNGLINTTESKEKENRSLSSVFLCTLVSTTFLPSMGLISYVSNKISKKISQDIYYEGELKNNLKHGKGREESSEYVYFGQFDRDLKNGLGKLMYKEFKDTYQGEFENNKITGKGKYRWGASKEEYEGTFRDGKMHGKGVYKWPDGSKYTGEYVDGIKEGIGEFIWANGKLYEGPFLNGKPEGKGKMISKGLVYDCEHSEGKLLTTEKVNPLNNPSMLSSLSKFDASEIMLKDKLSSIKFSFANEVIDDNAFFNEDFKIYK